MKNAIDAVSVVPQACKGVVASDHIVRLFAEYGDYSCTFDGQSNVHADVD